MNDFTAKHSAFKRALAAWEVEKTTDRYTDLMAAHADLTKAYVESAKLLGLCYGLACVVTTVVAMWSIFA